MIVARSPLRITLGGGGTDLPSYSDQHEGFAIAAAIDAHVSVTITDRLGLAADALRPDVDRIVAAALDMLDVDGAKITITSRSDVPPGTGLGSSGSFTTALLAALSSRRGIEIEPGRLARQAFTIEADRLEEPVGRQDQHIAVSGGIQCMTFRRDGTVQSETLPMTVDDRARLETELLLFFTGIERPARSILIDQDRRTRALDETMLENLHATKDLASHSMQVLVKGDFEQFGWLMDEHWRLKRDRSPGMSTSKIDDWYRLARAHGATGGKLIGAGAGGFLMFHTKDPDRLRSAMRAAALSELPFRFEDHGTRVLR